MKKIILAILIIAVLSQNCSSQIMPNYINTSNYSLLRSDNEFKFDIIGGGSALTSFSGTGKNQGKGATGLSFYKEGICQGSVIFNLGTNGTMDFTNSQINGATLLIPGNSGQSLQIDYRSYKINKNERLGVNFSATFNLSDTWKKNDTSFSANVLSSRLQLSYLLLNPPPTDKLKIMLTADLGVTYRGILGDVATEDDFKKSIFGSPKSHYLGTELNVDLWINDVRLFFSLPLIFGDEVKGLTNGQIILGGSVSGKMFKNL